jgi:CDP-glucose 4,6-dehydratase
VSGTWKGRRVLVTGAGGFVGSWLASALADRGARVVCLQLRERHSNIEVLGLKDRVEVVYGDLVDLELMRGLVRDQEIDSCFHLAAQALVGVANASPLSTFESNVRGTWNLLEACREAGTLQRIVVASSDKAYGDQDTLPYTEDMPLVGRWPYDASKACADLISRSYAHAYGMPVTVTRMANTYGGGDFNFSRIVPGTIRSALLGENPIVRSDGTPVRDYLHVDDAVAAYLTLAEHVPEDGVRGHAFNFGTNAPVPVLELVERILRHAGDESLRPDVLLKEKIHGEIDRQFLDSTRAHHVLGWRARVSLDDGLAQTIDWYRAHLKLIREAA